MCQICQQNMLPFNYSCSLSTATIEYSCLSVYVSVCTSVCLSVYNITKTITCESN